MCAALHKRRFIDRVSQPKVSAPFLISHSVLHISPWYRQIDREIIWIATARLTMSDQETRGARFKNMIGLLSPCCKTPRNKQGSELTPRLATGGRHKHKLLQTALPYAHAMRHVRKNRKKKRIATYLMCTTQHANAVRLSSMHDAVRHVSLGTAFSSPLMQTSACVGLTFNIPSPEMSIALWRNPLCSSSNVHIAADLEQWQCSCATRAKDFVKAGVLSG